MPVAALLFFDGALVLPFVFYKAAQIIQIVELGQVVWGGAFAHGALLFVGRKGLCIFNIDKRKRLGQLHPLPSIIAK